MDQRLEYCEELVKVIDQTLQHRHVSRKRLSNFYRESQCPLLSVFVPGMAHYLAHRYRGVFRRLAFPRPNRE